MFPAPLQKTFAWLVPAFIATLGVSAITAWRRAPVKTRWLLSAGVLALAHGVLTIANLRLQGNDYQFVHFSAERTGFGPHSIAIDFVAQCCLVAAFACLSVAAIRAGGAEPWAVMRRPFLVLLSGVVLVFLGYFLLEAL